MQGLCCDHREVRSVHRLSWRVGQTRRFVLAGCCCSSQAGKDRAPPGEAGRGPWSFGLEPAEGRLHPCGRRSLAREAGLPTRCSCLLSRRHLRHASPAWPPPVFRRDGGGSRCSRARGAVRPALLPTGLLSSGCSSVLGGTGGLLARKRRVASDRCPGGDTRRPIRARRGGIATGGAGESMVRCHAWLACGRSRSEALCRRAGGGDVGGRCDLLMAGLSRAPRSGLGDGLI